MIKIVLPTHLQRLASVGREIDLQVEPPVTINSILDTLEEKYPVLRGTVRDHYTKERRDFIRFFACGEDFSLESPDTLLPEQIASGTDKFMIVGALAGG